MKFLVTGGAGFIGSHITNKLIKEGHGVRVLDNFVTGKRANLSPLKDSIEIIDGDIRNYHSVVQAMKGIEVVIHQAALPSVPRSISDPVSSNQANITGTLNILHAANEVGVKRVVAASSSSVYGNSPSLPKVETMTPNPLSPYAVSKLAGEQYCGVFTRIYGLETFALRYFNVFGPRQDPNSQYAAVIPKFVTLMLKGEAPTIYGDGEQSRDFSYIENVVNANYLAATTDNETGKAMNIACHHRITLNELVEHLNDIIGSDIEPKYLEERQGDVKHSLADITLARTTIVYEPTISVREGLEKVVEYFQQSM